MARRVRIQSLIAAVLMIVGVAAGSQPAGSSDGELRARRSTVLANYTFDEFDLTTGPDTFAIFENAKGRVDLAGDIRHSGYYSLAITDVAGDGDFPELQGYYPVVSRGMLRFRFAMLVATPNEPLNIALAGPNHFSMQKDGIAFWLKTSNGWLHHVSDGIPKKLVLLQPFVWYVFDVRYAVSKGTYDLVIMREGESAPAVSLKDQPNATSSAESAVSMFSFVGSVFEDDSNVHYYIDDIGVATDVGGEANGFVAPGRRKLFIDRWHEAAKAAAARKGCPPVFDFEDVGASATDVDEARERFAELNVLCTSLDREETWKALEARAAATPGATAYALASIVALTRLGRWRDAEMRWMSLEPRLRNDIRYGTMAALIGMHRQNWVEAEAWLRAPAEDVARWQKDVERKLIAEEYYFVLLWKKEYAAASRYAERVADRLAQSKIDAASWWRERAGDAEMLAGHHRDAKRMYEAALSDDNRWSVTEKLADIAYLLGDTEGERKLREKLYGRL